METDLLVKGHARSPGSNISVAQVNTVGSSRFLSSCESEENIGVSTIYTVTNCRVVAAINQMLRPFLSDVYIKW